MATLNLELFDNRLGFFIGPGLAVLCSILLVSCHAIESPHVAISETASSEHAVSGQLWELNLEEDLTSIPITDDFLLYFQTTKELYSIDSFSGSAIWNSNVPGDPSRIVVPVIDDFGLVSADYRSCVSVVDVRTGAIRWRRCPTDTIARSDWEPSGIPIMSLENFSNSIAVVRYNWAISLYRGDSGALLWELPIPNRRTVSVIDCGGHICIDLQNSVTRLRLSDATTLAERHLEGEIGPIASYGDAVYVVHAPNRASLSSLYVQNLNGLWGVDLAEIFPGGIRHLTVNEELVVVSGRGIASVDPRSGSIHWERSDLGELGPPSITKSSVFVKDTQETVIELDPNTGHIKRTFPPPEVIQWPGRPRLEVVEVKGILIIPYRNGQIRAFQLND